jgi:hypothetical protein
VTKVQATGIKQLASCSDISTMRSWWLQFFGLSAVIFEYSPRRHLGFDPVEELGGRINLIVVFALWEDGQTFQVWTEICGIG